MYASLTVFPLAGRFAKDATLPLMVIEAPTGP
jgi:hypothetical protein